MVYAKWLLWYYLCVIGKEEERQMFQQMQAMAQKQVENAFIYLFDVSVCACLTKTKSTPLDNESLMNYPVIETSCR